MGNVVKIIPDEIMAAPQKLIEVHELVSIKTLFKLKKRQ